MQNLWQTSLRIRGTHFRPSQLPIQFSQQHDVGAIAQTGPYRGKPQPYGAASYQVPESISITHAFEHLADTFEPLLNQLTSCGAEESHVSLGRFYAAQCNEEYRPEELQHLLRLKCGFTYSAYQISKEEEVQIEQAMRANQPNLAP